MISAQILGGNKALKVNSTTAGVLIQTPEKSSNDIATVIKLEVEFTLQTISRRDKTPINDRGYIYFGNDFL